MRKYIGVLIILLISSPIVRSQKDESFLNSIYMDFIDKECDSFLLLVSKNPLQINEYTESELKKVLPKKVVAEICNSANEKKKSQNWDLSLLKNAQPIYQEQKRIKEHEFMQDDRSALDSLYKIYGLDTIPDLEVVDSLLDEIYNRGTNFTDFKKITNCYNQIYIFSRPAYSLNGEYVIIAFSDHRWIPNAMGYTAVYRLRKGKWKRVAIIDQWVS